MPAARSKRGRGRPRKSDVTDRRDLLLQVARKTFAEEGYAASSLRVIAAGAGVDVALITHIFGSKFDLWKAVVDEYSDRLLEAIEQVVHPLDHAASIDSIRGILSYYIDVMCDTPHLAQFIARGSTQNNERFEYIYAKLAKPMHDLMVPILDREGRTDSDPDFLFFVLSCSVCMAVASREFLVRYNPEAGRDAFFRAELKRITFAMLPEAHTARREPVSQAFSR